MACSLPGSSVCGDSPGKNTGVGCHALLQGIFWPRDQTHVSCIADRFFTISATQKAPVYLLLRLKNPFILFTLFLNLGLSVFPSNSLIFCRILPFSSDMCSTSPSLRNFFNTLYCFLANFLEKIKLYTCFFHSYNIIKATFSDNKWSDDHIQSVVSLWCFIF